VATKESMIRAVTISEFGVTPTLVEIPTQWLEVKALYRYDRCFYQYATDIYGVRVPSQRYRRSPRQRRREATSHVYCRP
jgi:hypothetical protein